MGAEKGVKSFLMLQAICVIFTCRIAVGNSELELQAELPKLPDGVLEAADIELRLDRSIYEREIPGYKNEIESRGRIFFRKDAGAKGPCTMDEAAARKLASAFIDEHFPQIAQGKQFWSQGRWMSSDYQEDVNDHGKTMVDAHVVKYVPTHKSIPILEDVIVVRIKGDEVESLTLSAHSVKETAKPSKLLSASECLEKVSNVIKLRSAGAGTVRSVMFGYRGGFRQHWEDEREDWSKPLKAVPAYTFVVKPARGGFLNDFVFDARSAEVISPKDAKGRSEVEIKGPELVFAGAGSKRLFLIGPRDIKIKKAVFEMESVPVEDSWFSYRPRDLLTEPGWWHFTDWSYPERGHVCLASNWRHSGRAVGAINIETPGAYVVEALVYQGGPNKVGRALRMSIAGESRILGKKGPDTARVWERWGVIELSKGKHEVILEPGPGSEGSWELGSVRLRHTGDPNANISSVRDLKISFGRGDNPDYQNREPPVGHFESENLYYRLESALRHGLRGAGGGRNITCISISSGQPGIFHIRTLTISFVTSDQDLAERKAEEFVLIYPDGGSSRPLLPEELRTFGSYIQRIVASKDKRWLGLYERFDLCEFAQNVIGGYEVRVVKKILGELEKEHLSLVGQEVEILANCFFLYDADSPPPVEYVKGWDERFLWHRDLFDERRIVDNSTYLDPWGNAYILEYSPKRKWIHVRSCGPNSKDDKGRNDDIKGEAEISLLRW